MKPIITSLILSVLVFSISSAQTNKNSIRANDVLDSTYKYYGIPNSQLLREHHPFKNDYKADYLGGGDHANNANPYAYLWPYSGSLSAHVALYEATKSKTTKLAIDKRVLVGLQNYYDTRTPEGYASYVSSAPQSDRFYDDNVWIGIDFTDLYLLTKEKQYLDKAVEVWEFVASGMDEKLGGGIYWCEQRKESKNTCSNAPSIVYLAKLYQATKQQKYLDLAKQLYQWTQTNLMDKEDYVYFDNINLKGKVDKRKYAYNSGQMIQAGVLLFNLTKEKQYLVDAQQVAQGAFDAFFALSEKDADKPQYIFKTSNNWFIAVMVRGYVELYKADKNKTYTDIIKQNLDYAWQHLRADNGLFTKEWDTTKNSKDAKWLLDQFAMVEMYSKLSAVK